MSNSNCFFHPDRMPIPTGEAKSQHYSQNKLRMILPPDGENEPIYCLLGELLTDRQE